MSSFPKKMINPKSKNIYLTIVSEILIKYCRSRYEKVCSDHIPHLRNSSLPRNYGVLDIDVMQTSKPISQICTNDYCVDLYAETQLCQWFCTEVRHTKLNILCFVTLNRHSYHAAPHCVTVLWALNTNLLSAAYRCVCPKMSSCLDLHMMYSRAGCELFVRAAALQDSAHNGTSG